jgi:hypothetical protein
MLYINAFTVNEDISFACVLANNDTSEHLDTCTDGMVCFMQVMFHLGQKFSLEYCIFGVTCTRRFGIVGFVHLTTLA